jgi:hypothetical protein
MMIEPGAFPISSLFGGIAIAVGCVLLTIVAMRRGVMWTLCYVVLPGGIILFIARHWKEARIGLAVTAVGLTVFSMRVGADSLPWLQVSYEDANVEFVQAPIDMSHGMRTAPISCVATPQAPFLSVD